MPRAVRHAASCIIACRCAENRLFLSYAGIVDMWKNGARAKRRKETAQPGSSPGRESSSRIGSLHDLFMVFLYKR
jgi:hypothetical protein